MNTSLTVIYFVVMKLVEGAKAIGEALKVNTLLTRCFRLI